MYDKSLQILDAGTAVAIEAHWKSLVKACKEVDNTGTTTCDSDDGPSGL